MGTFKEQPIHFTVNEENGSQRKYALNWKRSVDLSMCILFQMTPWFDQIVPQDGKS